MDKNKIKMVLGVSLMGETATKYKLIYVNPYYFRKVDSKYFSSSFEFMIYNGIQFKIEKDLFVIPMNLNNIESYITYYRNNIIRQINMKILYKSLLEWSDSMYWKNTEFIDKPSIRCIEKLWYIY
jgi:hypothetical protein